VTNQDPVGCAEYAETNHTPLEAYDLALYRPVAGGVTLQTQQPTVSVDGDNIERSLHGTET
jgi:hypothetical protein